MGLECFVVVLVDFDRPLGCDNNPYDVDEWEDDDARLRRSSW